MLSVLFRKLRLVYDKCNENCAGMDPIPPEVRRWQDMTFSHINVIARQVYVCAVMTEILPVVRASLNTGISFNHAHHEVLLIAVKDQNLLTEKEPKSHAHCHLYS